MATRTYRACPPLREALKFSLVTQVILLLLAAMATDGGGVAQIAFFAFVGFNSYVGSVLLFRPRSPSKFDILLIKIGFLPTLFGAFFLAHHIWDLRGF
jgi:hypothetical protein